MAAVGVGHSRALWQQVLTSRALALGFLSFGALGLRLGCGDPTGRPISLKYVCRVSCVVCRVSCVVCRVSCVCVWGCVWVYVCVERRWWGCVKGQGGKRHAYTIQTCRMSASLLSPTHHAPRTITTATATATTTFFFLSFLLVRVFPFSPVGFICGWVCGGGHLKTSKRASVSGWRWRPGSTVFACTDQRSNPMLRQWSVAGEQPPNEQPNKAWAEARR